MEPDAGKSFGVCVVCTFGRSNSPMEEKMLLWGHDERRSRNPMLLRV